jgi:hypothetical protein
MSDRGIEAFFYGPSMDVEVLGESGVVPSNVQRNSWWRATPRYADGGTEARVRRTVVALNTF